MRQGLKTAKPTDGLLSPASCLLDGIPSIDPAAAKYRVAVVEDDCLPRRDRALGLLEHHRYALFAKWLDRGGCVEMAMTNACRDRTQ